MSAPLFPYPNPLGPLADPDLTSVLQSFKNEIFWGLNCHQVGSIVAFDPLTGQAQVQIMMQRVVFNQVQLTSLQFQLQPTIVNYPVLVNCPVFAMTGGGFVVTMPVAVGDLCLLLFNDRDIDIWFSTGNISPPNTSRAHDLSDGFALVGFRNLPNVVANYSATAAEMRSSDNTAKVSIAQALSQLINATEVKLAVGTTAIDLDTAHIGIANSNTSLKLAVSALITALLNWVDTHGDTPNAATVTALNNAQTTFNSLLK